MIKFGVAGNSNSFYAEGHERTVDAAKWCFDRGIDVFEYSFGRGVNMTEATARVLGTEFGKFGVELTAHAPYFINFANENPEQIQKSIQYIMSSIKRVKLFNGNRVVFHPASQGKLERSAAVARAVDNMKLLVDTIDASVYSDLIICPETMGKLGQIGTVSEIIEFCGLAGYLYPCIDFGHLNARTFGGIKTKNDYKSIIVQLLDYLPSYKVKNMHVHFSKIQYSKGGEVKHLTFSDTEYGPEFAPLAEVLCEYAIEPVIISESDGTQAEDAVTMKNEYFSLITK